MLVSYGLYDKFSHTDVPRDKAYILVQFPENYRLYEHVKKSVTDGPGPKLSKTHAGGGNERQDAYLYGHPMGRKKRFRSPADYYPHLYWLATDSSGDPDNCACKICTPEELEERQQPIVQKREIKQEKTVKEELKAESPMRQRSVSGPLRQASTQSVKQEHAPSPAPRAALTPVVDLTAAQPKARALARPVKQDQVMDLAYNIFIFRQGELVWFNRGSAWGLGMISRRWRQENDQKKVRYYSVQPLSHPYRHSQPQTVQGDENLRPWLTWTVPPFTSPGLNSINVTYETADWHGIFNGKYGQGDAEVDGSILAAKAVDLTFTTFEPSKFTEISQLDDETHWTGLYLGAEKIWIGDVVRLKGASGIDVLVVHDIVERSRKSAMNKQVIEQSIQIVGDEYTLTQSQQSSTTQLFPPGTELMNLPQRMVEDLRRRNLYTIQAKQVASSWKLTRAGVWHQLRDLKGRWYEATTLLPLINPSAPETDFRRGDINEAGLRMNNRFDCQKMPEGSCQDIRKTTRADTVQRAVPSNFKVVEGSAPPPQTEHVAISQQQSTAPQSKQEDAMVLDPAFSDVPVSTAAQSGRNYNEADGTNATADAGLDDFMDLSGVDTQEMPAFDQGYGQQGQRYFYE